MLVGFNSCFYMLLVFCIFFYYMFLGIRLEGVRIESNIENVLKILGLVCMC